LTKFSCALASFVIAGWAFSAQAETVVDVSHEWNAHVSSTTMTAPVNSASSVAPSTGMAQVTAQDCGCEAMTPQEYLEDSTYAFTGIVEETSKPKAGKRKVLFDVDEIFKGTPKPDTEVTVDVAGDVCDLPYLEGQSYLVFAKWEWGNVLSSRCMGTKLLPKPTLELGPSEALKEKLYIRLRNACMGRLDTVCCLSSLKAMRTGCFVPEPEDGCPSGSIPDRLHCGGSYTWCIPVTDKGHR
jgi:hypothetical protein